MESFTKVRSSPMIETQVGDQVEWWGGAAEERGEKRGADKAQVHYSNIQ